MRVRMLYNSELYRVFSVAFYFIFFGFLIMTILLKAIGFRFSNDYVKVACYITYFFTSICLMLILYYERKIILKYVSFVLPMILYSLMFWIKPILAIPLVGLIIAYCLKKNVKYKLVILFITLGWVILIIGLSFIFTIVSFIMTADVGFPMETILNEKVSPNGELKITVKELDQGALGGEIVVSVESVDDEVKVINDINILGIIEKKYIQKPFSKYIECFSWGEEPIIDWIDNRIIKVNNKTYDIYSK